MAGKSRRGNGGFGPLKVFFILALSIGLAVAVYVLSGLLAEPTLPAVRGSVVTEAPLRWENAEYKKKKRLTTLLFIGVDREELAQTGTFIRDGGQADFLFVLAVDDAADTVYPLHIDRDTITPVTVTSIMGKPVGTRNAQICLSYGFGTSPKQCCELASQAVSGLLGGHTIDHYLAVNMGAIGSLNDAVGGVSVQLEQDLTVLDPAWTAGTMITLHGRQAEDFVRARMSVGAGTNAERMVRQQAYLTGLKEALLQGMKTDGEKYLNALFQVIDATAVKDVSDDWLLNQLWKMRNYTWTDVITIEGKHAIGTDGFMEYHADANSVQEAILRLYYDSTDS